MNRVAIHPTYMICSTYQPQEKEEQKMNNKGIGAVFCLISAILISAKYISAAIFMSGVNTWDATLFAAGLGYVGPFLSIASAVALIVGLLFLGYGVYEEIRKKQEINRLQTRGNVANVFYTGKTGKKHKTVKGSPLQRTDGDPVI